MVIKIVRKSFGIFGFRADWVGKFSLERFAGDDLTRLLFSFCLLVPLLFTQGCVVNDALQADNSDNLTSSWVRPNDPSEIVGSREHPIVLAKYGGEYRDPKVDRLLAVIVGRLVAVSEAVSYTHLRAHETDSY